MVDDAKHILIAMVRNAALLDGFNPISHGTYETSIRQAIHKKTDDTEPILPTILPTLTNHPTNYIQNYPIYLFHCTIFCFGIILGKLFFGSTAFNPTNPYNTHTSLVNNELIYWPLPQGFSPLSFPAQRNITQHYFLNTIRSNLVVNGGFLDAYYNATS